MNKVETKLRLHVSDTFFMEWWSEFGSICISNLFVLSVWMLIKFFKLFQAGHARENSRRVRPCYRSETTADDNKSLSSTTKIKLRLEKLYKK